MILQIAQALPPTLLADFQRLSKEDDFFADGRDTAGWHAKTRKHNLQARTDTAVQKLLARAESELLRHELVQAATRPKAIIRTILNRYDGGMHYGTHVDDAIMDGQRSDISFTLFLTPPQDYEGGSLVIDEPAGERSFKLEAGTLLLYPANTLHRIEAVTQGRRFAIVGWIHSFLRHADRREILFDLERSIAQLRGQVGHDPATLELILKTRSNLLRLWVE